MDKWNLLLHSLYRDKDEGAGGSTEGKGDKTQGTTPPTNTENATGTDKPSDSGRVTFTSEQQAHIDSVIAERLKRAEKKWGEDTETAKKKAEEEAEAKHLEEQKKFEELANKRQAKIVELETKLGEVTGQLETLTKERDVLKGVVDKFLEEQRKGLPEHIIALLDKLDAAEQLAYIAENADTLKKANGSGIGSPRPKGQQQRGDASGDSGKPKPAFRLPRL